MATAQMSRETHEQREAWRTRVLLACLVFGVVSSVVHYTDNFIRFDQYPQDEPKLVTRPLIPVSWIVFTIAAVWGYRRYRDGRWAAAAGALAFYSISGLISPIHYTAAPLSEFDALQHVFIVTDGIAGALVLGFAVWLWRRHRSATTRVS